MSLHLLCVVAHPDDECFAHVVLLRLTWSRKAGQPSSPPTRLVDSGSGRSGRLAMSTWRPLCDDASKAAMTGSTDAEGGHRVSSRIPDVGVRWGCHSRGHAQVASGVPEKSHSCPVKARSMQPDVCVSACRLGHVICSTAFGCARCTWVAQMLPASRVSVPKPRRQRTGGRSRLCRTGVKRNRSGMAKQEPGSAAKWWRQAYATAPQRPASA